MANSFAKDGELADAHRVLVEDKCARIAAGDSYVVDDWTPAPAIPGSRMNCIRRPGIDPDCGWVPNSMPDYLQRAQRDDAANKH